MLAKFEDLMDAGLGKKSAKTLMRLIKQEKPYWMVVFAAQREYNFYLRSLGHVIQPLLKYEPIPEEIQNNYEEDRYSSSSEYTESQYTRSSAFKSELMSELDDMLEGIEEVE